MKIVIKTSNLAHSDVLSLYVKPLKVALMALKKKYSLILPKQLLLRPLRQYTSKKCMSLTFARAGYDIDKGYYIALNMKSFSTEPSPWLLDTIAHEAAHIGEAIKTKKWSHGKLFDEMYEIAKKSITKRGG